MATLSDHADNIRLAIRAAEDDGYVVEIDTNVARSRHGYPTVALDIVEYEDDDKRFSVLFWEEILHEEREDSH